MKILLISATDMETAPFRETYLNDQASRFEGVEVRFLTTGIGMLSTAARLTSALNQYSPDLLIQAGIAGSFSNNFSPGDVYRVQSDLIADMGVMENRDWKDVFDLGLADENASPYKAGKLMAREPAFALVSHIPAVDAITVNTITTDPQRIKQLKQRYAPALESMEGAALHFVGIEHNLHFLQLRAVSNYVGERNKTNWRIREAITNLNESLPEIMAACAQIKQPGIKDY